MWRPSQSSDLYSDEPATEHLFSLQLRCLYSWHNFHATRVVFRFFSSMNQWIDSTQQRRKHSVFYVAYKVNHK